MGLHSIQLATPHLIENVHTDSERAVGIDVLEFLFDTLPWKPEAYYLPKW